MTRCLRMNEKKNGLLIALTLIGGSILFAAQEDSSHWLKRKAWITTNVAEAEFEPIQVQPEWKSKLIESWPSGAPKELLFVDDSEWPRKKLLYYPSGALFQEIDLAPPTSSPHLKGTHHGALWSYYEDGTTMRTEKWEEGKKEGVEKSFSEEGVLEEERHFSKGLLQGFSLSYFASGEIKEKTDYAQGKKEGVSELFWEDGTKQREERFKKGLRQGKSISWWENGAVRSVSFWLNGLLHTTQEGHALSKYSKQGKLEEQEDFIGGLPHGQHLRWHENGTVKMKALWRMGKKEGPQDYYDENGRGVGHREFIHGMLIGSFWKENPQGQIIMKGECPTPGSGEVQLFDQYGTQRISYGMKEGKLHGEFLERNSNGRLEKQLSFFLGELHGTQQGFFQTGENNFRFEYSHGKRIREQEQWYQNGQRAARASFSENGLRDGLFEIWYINGKKRCQMTYRNGVLDGTLFSWHENGEKELAETWTLGLQTAMAYEWSPTGQLLKQEEWKEGLPQGEWKEWYESGKKKSEKSFLQGKKEGRETEWYESGRLARIYSWKNDVRDGLSEEWFEDGSLSSKGAFIAGQPDGIHETRFDKEEAHRTGVIATQERFMRGKLHGKQTAFYPKGQLKMEALYQDGVLEGEKKCYTEEGQLFFSASYRNGRLEGPLFNKREDGYEEVKNYKDNHPEGLFIIYYPERETFGRLKAVEMYYMNGLLQGPYVEYTPTGQTSFSIFYQRGLREGEGCFFRPDGRLEMSVQFHNGKLNGPFQMFYPSGALERTGHFEEDLQEGEEQHLFENGKLSQRSFYRHGKLNGKIEAFDQKGHLLFEGHYVDGLRSGVFTKYDASGKVRVQQKFEHDVLIERKESK